VGDPVATITEALKLAPDFVLGHVFRATILMTFTERRFAEQARASVASAEALLPRANAREQGLVAAARRLVDGDWGAACRDLDRVLVDYPRDAFAIQSAHLMDFFRGDALNLRNRISRVLPHWSPSVPGYSYVLGMHAFGLEECNQYPQAEEAARQALALQPKDGWAVHAGAHVMEMQGHRRRHRLAGVAGSGLGPRQRVRFSQLLAPGALLSRPPAVRRCAGALRQARAS
jgi:tetratricopeptide (TPR) repeat protein